MALQLESGERLVKEFSSSSTLWDVLCHWDSNQDSSHRGKILNPVAEENKSPVCIYMTQEIGGEISLQNATLHSLGLTGKRAVIRLLHRQLEKQAEIAEKTEIPPVLQEDREPTPKDISNPGPLLEDKDTGCTTEKRTINKPVVMSATSSSESTSQLGMSTEAQRDVRMDERNSSKMRPKDLDTNIQEGSNEPKRARISPPKPLLANFKFPEETAGMNLFQREQADSSRKEFLATSCDRQPVVFSEEDPSSPKPDEGELPDAFFEVTVDDIRVMLRDLKNERNQADTAPLMTRAMREVREEAEMYKYDRVVVRIKFPDRLILQAFFRPMEKVSAVSTFVKSYLQDPNVKFYLYTTPPRKILDKPNATLFDNKLYPASVIHFGCQEKREHFLARRFVENPSTVLDAERAVVENGVLSVRSSARPDIGDSLVSSSNMDSNQEPGASSYGDDRSAMGHNPGASNRPRAGGAIKGPVPKWFKGTGK